MSQKPRSHVRSPLILKTSASRATVGHWLSFAPAKVRANQDIDGVGVWTVVAEGQDETRNVAGFGGVTSWSPDDRSLAYVVEDRQRDEKGKTFMGDPERAGPRLLFASKHADPGKLSE